MTSSEPSPTPEAIRAALAQVIDPHTGQDLVSGHAIRGVGVDAGKVAVDVQLAYPAGSWHEALLLQ